MGGIDFPDLAITLKEAFGDIPAVVIGYGKFIQTAVDFTIIAFAIFIAIKGINALKRKEEEAPASAIGTPGTGSTACGNKRFTEESDVSPFQNNSI